MAALTDDELVRRVLAGEQDAFGVLLARYDPLIRAVVRRHPVGGDAAIGRADLAQEIAARVYARLAAYTPGGRFGGWLGTVATNCLVDIQRRRRFVTLVLDHLPERPDPAQEPEPAALAHEVGEAIVMALATLSDRQADAVWRCCAGGQSLGEAADAAGVPVTAMRGRLHKGRERLRRLLGGMT